MWYCMHHAQYIEVCDKIFLVLDTVLSATRYCQQKQEHEYLFCNVAQYDSVGITTVK